MEQDRRGERGGGGGKGRRRYKDDLLLLLLLLLPVLFTPSQEYLKEMASNIVIGT